MKNVYEVTSFTMAYQLKKNDDTIKVTVPQHGSQIHAHTQTQTHSVIYRSVPSLLVVTILAGGKGKRMKSELPKVLHCVDGVPMLVRIVKQVLILNTSKIVIVVGEFEPQIRECLVNWFGQLGNEITYARQQESKGTGDAVSSTLDHIDPSNINVILNGDNPLLTHTTIQYLIDQFNNCKSDLQITAIKSSNPYGCGRIIVSEQGDFQKIVEEKDCSETEKSINTVNCGIYIARGNILKSYIPNIKNNNASGEYYLTDIVEITKNADKHVTLCVLDESKEREIFNINTAEELDRINKLLYV